MAPFSALQVANSGYITKPFSIKVVIEKVRTILKRYSGLQDNEIIHCGPSLPLANYLHNKIFPDFARFSLLFFAPYVIIIM